MTDQQDLRAQLSGLVQFVNGKCTNEEAGRKCLGFIVQYGEHLIDLLREASAQLGRVGELVGYVHPDTIKGLQAGLCTKSYLFAKPMPQVWADVPLYTIPQLPAGVPEGWVLVPVEPTESMRRAGQCQLDIGGGLDGAWERMIANAPQPDSKEPR